MNGKTQDFNPGMKVNSLFPRMFLQNNILQFFAYSDIIDT